MLGSAVSNNVVTDPTLHKNRKVKVRVRNLSGDAAFDLKTVRRRPDGDLCRGRLRSLRRRRFRHPGRRQRARKRPRSSGTWPPKYAFLGAAAGGGSPEPGAAAPIAQGAGILAGAALRQRAGQFPDRGHLHRRRRNHGRVDQGRQADHGQDHHLQPVARRLPTRTTRTVGSRRNGARRASSRTPTEPRSPCSPEAPTRRNRGSPGWSAND